jgi:cytidylate kinase
MAVITISRQFGSSGDEVAHRIAEILDYQIFDKRLVIKTAREVGLSEQEIVDFSEENHKVRGFLERLFAPTQLASEALIWREDAAGVLTEGTYLQEDVQLNLMQKAIRSAHDMGRLIIMGRGGQVILRDQPDVLHIRVEMPLEDRIQRIKEDLRQARQEYYADLHLRREAQDLITTRDAVSADYLKHYYHVDWADPALYHLVINTGKLTIEQAANLVARLVLEMPSTVPEEA